MKLSLLLAVGLAVALGADDDGADDDGEAATAALKAEFIQAAKAGRFGRIEPVMPTPQKQDKIDHFVVLYMENHAADNYFGCMGLPGFDGIEKGHSIPVDPNDPSKGVVNVTCDGSAPYVCRSGPGYDTFAGKFPAIGGSPHKYPYSAQDDKYSALHGASAGGTAVTMFTPEQIPVKHAIAKEFGVFNKLYTAVPSASSPNHLFTQSATSCGMQTNTLYDKCGGKKVTFPQRTIYDSLRAHNVSFGLYMNSTCGLDGKPCHGESQHDPDSASAINTPDVAMEGVARHQVWRNSAQFFTRNSAQFHSDGLSSFALRTASTRRRSSTSARRTARSPRSRGSCRRSRRATTRATTSQRASGCSKTSTRRFAPGRSGSARCSSSRTTTPAATTTTSSRRTRASPPTSRRASCPASTPSAVRSLTFGGSGCGRRRC